MRTESRVEALEPKPIEKDGVRRIERPRVVPLRAPKLARAGGFLVAVMRRR